MIEVAN